MRFSTGSLLSLSLAGLPVAQAINHLVSVGKGGELKFQPENLVAKQGDTVTYEFYAKNHSVTQSSFSEPCKPLANGFFSAFVPSQSQDTAAPTRFTITLEDVSKPIWVYCGQTNGNHCQKGMVHSINAPDTGDKTLQAFKDLAKDAPTSTSPADGLPAPGAFRGVRTIDVEVGKDGKLEFQPNNILEPPNTLVKFHFNPKNHSVVQSTFDTPCKSFQEGFSSGHIPVANSPSGVTFQFTIPDRKPFWFYCAQTNGDHCQKGMVGAINAPAEGDKTLEKYIAKAKAASAPSTIEPFAPLVGEVFVNGTEREKFGGNVLPSNGAGNVQPPASTVAGSPDATRTAFPGASQTLPSGPDAGEYFENIAGGGKPKHWGWADKMTGDAVDFLQLHLRIEDLLAHLLWEAYSRLEVGGVWHEQYPPTIVDAIGAWTGQSVVHMATTYTCLVHYNNKALDSCKWKLPLDNVNTFLNAFNRINLAQIGAMIDISSSIAAADPFIVPILLTQVGSKSRAAGVVNMMQSHSASISPREIALPAPLAWSFILANYVESCPQGLKIDGLPDKPWPVLNVPSTKVENNVTVSITLQYEGSQKDYKLAWIGPWGDLEFSDIDNDTKVVPVPKGWTGDVFIAVVKKKDMLLGELAANMVAGPNQVWL
ncbi:hypothetical protein QBC35DRAFT_473840 [Podospora australis]|uniref:Cupredoxin n=1 Tax=Podospora australis TaxID=1536484 RepID=A0AAN7AI45_9PEZI|nr:hypothetical protein QBC35DRAFT_473840 [Podospora australis]